MRSFLAAFLFLALPAQAWADARQYAILSLVGDELTVVQREMTAGSNLDKNTRAKVPTGSDYLDRTMLLAVDKAVRGSDPAANPVLLAPRDPKLYALAAKSLDGGGTAALYEAVRPIVTGAKATHLILVNKHRAKARLRVEDGYLGDGTLEGIGFYIDYGSPTRASGALMNDSERGFIASYGYFKMAVIEVASGRIVAEEYVLGSESHQPTAGTIGAAWKSLSDQDKDKQITRVIQEEAARVVPKLLATR